MAPRHDCWTACLLSLAVPGAGQLYCGNPWCLVWFTANGGWLLLGMTESYRGVLWIEPLCWISFLGLAFTSARHAKRLCELPAGSVDNGSLRPDVTVRTSRSTRAVQACIRLTVPTTPGQLWNRVSDLPRFLTVDPFHARVVLMRPGPGKGVDLVLHHEVMGLPFPRFGRILYWQEGQGYAFSDLSRHGPRQGFPHVFVVGIKQLGVQPPSCELTIQVRGKWTSRFVPRCCAHLWVSLVCRQHARLLREELTS